MISRELLIENKLGLHARAASKFVAVAKEYSSDITVTSAHAKANGKSIMNVMMLQASIGTTITIEVSGEDEAAAADAITSLVAEKFHEAE